MMIPHFRPGFEPSAAEALIDTFQSGYIVQGPRVRQLEQQLEELIGRHYAVAVSSGTTALTLALRVAGVNPLDEVIIPAYTCAALWQAVCALGAIPVFADIENETFNADPCAIKALICPRTRAIIFPHMFGQPGFIQEIMDSGIPVIEDIAQAIGARIDGLPAGRFGSLTITSFYATKMIGAGEGGAILTDDPVWAEKLRDLRDYDEKDDLHLRFNAKMTDLTAAIASAQLSHLPAMITARQQILSRFDVLHEIIRIPTKTTSSFDSNLYRCIISIPGSTSEAIISQARAAGIICRKPVFRPLHHYHPHPPLAQTESAWQTQVSVPFYPRLQDHEIQLLVTFFNSIFRPHDER